MYQEPTEADYQAAIDFVASIANELCQNNVPIVRVGFQGSL